MVIAAVHPGSVSVVGVRLHTWSCLILSNWLGALHRSVYSGDNRFAARCLELLFHTFTCYALA